MTYGVIAILINILVASLPLLHSSGIMLLRKQHDTKLVLFTASWSFLRSQALAASLLSYLLYSGMMPLIRARRRLRHSCHLTTSLSFICAQALAASSPSYLYSGIIATHLHYQALVTHSRFLRIMLDEHSLSIITTPH
jgi:hypothetical protein